MDHQKLPPEPEGNLLFELLNQCVRAGLTDEEMALHPEHGLIFSLSGMRKLAKLAPNPEAALAKVEQAMDLFALDEAKKRGLH